MKRVIIAVVAILMVYIGNAQPLKKGDTIPDLTFTDIKGKRVSFNDYFKQGYAIIIEFGATWCGKCWTLDQLKVMQTYYENYGPNGKLQKKKIMPVFIESDPSTTLDDLKGTGTNTMGDWISDKDYPIIDIKSFEEIIPLFQEGTGVVSMPAFMAICSDKTVVFSQEDLTVGMSALTQSVSECKANPTDIYDITQNENMSIYPNPVSNQMTIQHNLDNNDRGSLQIVTISGQLLYSEQISLSQKSITLSASQFPAGVYIINLTSESGLVYKQKFVKL